MHVEFEKVPTLDKEGAVIKAVAMTEDIRSAMELLETGSGRIAVIREGQTYLCQIRDIYYIESVDKKTFLYTKNECFETKYRLYELERMLSGYFLRCSKAMIVNMRKIKAVKSELGGRMNATLLNGEVIVISRSYVKELKQRLFGQRTN
ncbi:MAG: LytTR family transcriptional regulator DNA-binding domain-containing protein [Acetatifactor sp.]|nr:LytTR family transcriptional regulator DNA-binding domain-containing protein [Acetatifactor sp.]